MKNKTVLIIFFLCLASVMCFSLAGYCFFNYRHFVGVFSYYGMPESELWKHQESLETMMTFIYGTIAYGAGGIVLLITAILFVVNKRKSTNPEIR
jgi:hypothetical protein